MALNRGNCLSLGGLFGTERSQVLELFTLEHGEFNRQKSFSPHKPVSTNRGARLVPSKTLNGPKPVRTSQCMHP